MKKFVLLILAVMAISHTAFAGERKERIIAIDYTNYLTDNGSAKMFGINYEIFLNENWSLNYNFGIGYSSDRAIFREPGGLLTGLGAFEYYFSHLDDFDPDEEFEEDESDNINSPLLLVGGVFMMFLPDGINYYIPLSHYVSAGLYFNPYLFDSADRWESMCSGIGIKIHFNLSEKLKIIPHIGYNIYWFTEPLPNIGISLGYKFR
jgi:hypothetical protein